MQQITIQSAGRWGGEIENRTFDLKKALELNPEGEEAQKINGKFSNFEDMYSNRIL